ncbi:hypothetical protein [Marinobacter subterrani]|uniref:hypothetical protein n=1 Tax=Marinobacter subterrani TaxID=1658765 RepID=UPI0012E1D5AD|nr:hypothetical protein [Marinobacter subterrani]
MEVNEYWNDRGAAERIDQMNDETDAGQVEQPVQMKSGIKVLKPESGNNRSPGKTDNRPPDWRMSSALHKLTAILGRNRRTSRSRPPPDGLLPSIVDL